jgi:hypothetical protein
MTRNRWQPKRRFSSETARKMGIASQKAQAERRMAAINHRALAETEIENLPRRQGDALGCLQWTDFRTGKARRWVVRIGDRADRITVESPGGKPSPSHGWTWFLTQLRKHLV